MQNAAADMKAALVFPEPGAQAIFRNLKRPALLFDRIKIAHLNGVLEFLGRLGTETELALRSELDWLIAREMVTAPDFEPYLVDHFRLAASEYPAGMPKAFEYCCEMTDLQMLIRLAKVPDADVVLLCSTIPRHMTLVAEAVNEGLRKGLAMKLPVSPAAERSPTQEVIQIVLKSFPLPRDDTPWEKILEFREDAVSQNQRWALRRWMRKVAQQDISPVELEEEIEWLTNEYHGHMRLHDLKTSIGTLESIIVGSGELLENVMKLRFGEIAKSLFSVQHKRIELAEAERAAPGRELAYIVKARRAFAVDGS